MRGALQQIVLFPIIWRIHFIYAGQEDNALIAPLLMDTISEQIVHSAHKSDDYTFLQIHEHSNRLQLNFEMFNYKDHVGSGMLRKTLYFKSKEINFPHHDPHPAIFRPVNNTAIAMFLAQNPQTTLTFKWIHPDRPCVSIKEPVGFETFTVKLKKMIGIQNDKIDFPYFLSRKLNANITLSGEPNIEKAGSFNYEHVDIMVPESVFNKFEYLIMEHRIIRHESHVYMRFKCDEEKVKYFPTIHFQFVGDTTDYFLSGYDYVLKDPMNGSCFIAIIPSKEDVWSIGGIFFRKYVTNMKITDDGKDFKFGLEQAEAPKKNFPIEYQIGYGTADNREN
uniref:AlNc14C404G11406 protein n=1 Tax=Albugo laibachii Nc14 TaxID=890382 RepID=F0WYZ6_9STRA|nr:AlNc14C404G11406 [Albugo laibachii Nc14]CCA27881.1 AlNc14C792G12515 [Albugo laibachii Nc14]|eukprot:CCA27881.1 AlNc14C792G12515 [Albugo laibachii Nc14]